VSMTGLERDLRALHANTAGTAGMRLRAAVFTRKSDESQRLIMLVEAWSWSHLSLVRMVTSHSFASDTQMQKAKSPKSEASVPPLEEADGHLGGGLGFAVLGRRLGPCLAMRPATALVAL